ncbi:MAG: M15 family metallopeptidase, partial [Acidimicrobiia bacterium]
DGYVIPLEVMAFDPDTYPAFLTKKDLSSFLTLNPGEILLGSTAAQMRGLGPGGAITLENGSTVAVTAVVDDVLIGGAEAAVSMRGAELVGVNVERYLLVRYGGSRKESESAIRAVIPNGVSVRLRAPGESPVLRHGDAVLPQALIKERFGEFEYRPDGSQGFELDPGWSRANIVTVDVPLLGSVTCHRNLLPALSGAMEELIDRNLSFLIRPAEFAGCFNPRFIANRRSISRHAWGAAVDINMGSNPEGVESAQDPRLIEVMERWGFTSGHDWLIPDPGHFEYLRPPETS